MGIKDPDTPLNPKPCDMVPGLRRRLVLQLFEPVLSRVRHTDTRSQRATSDLI